MFAFNLGLLLNNLIVLRVAEMLLHSPEQKKNALNVEVCTAYFYNFFILMAYNNY